MNLLQNLQDLDIGILKVIFESRNPLHDPILVGITNTAALLAFGIPGVMLIMILPGVMPIAGEKKVLAVFAMPTRSYVLPLHSGMAKIQY